MVTGLFRGPSCAMSAICAVTMRFESIYTPERSTRGISVYLCDHCGLAAEPAAHRSRRARAGSGIERRGLGKCPLWQRLPHQGRAGSNRAPRRSGREIALLDVGSNRGSFAKFLAAAPNAHIVAVEPDERVAHSCADLPRTDLIHRPHRRTCRSKPAGSISSIPATRSSILRIQRMCSPITGAF